MHAKSLRHFVVKQQRLLHDIICSAANRSIKKFPTFLKKMNSKSITLVQMFLLCAAQSWKRLSDKVI